MATCVTDILNPKKGGVSGVEEGKNRSSEKTNSN